MKQVISTLLCVFALAQCFSQSNLVKGSKFIDVKYGASKYSFPTYFHAEIGFCVKEKIMLRVGGGYEKGAVFTTAFENIYLNPDFMYNVYSLKNKLFLNLGLGAVGGIERINSTRNPFNDLTLIYGGRGLIEAEYFLFNKLSLKAEFAEWYVPESKLGKFFYTGTIGLSYVIN